MATIHEPGRTDSADGAAEERVPISRAFLLRRTAAAAGLVSAGLHLTMVDHGSWVWSLVLLIMAVACVPCALHLWCRETTRSWLLIGTMNAAMLVAHLGMVMTAHQGGRPAVGMDHAVAGHTGGTLFLLATAVAAGEVLLAGGGVLVGRGPVVDVVLQRPECAARTGGG